jgi:putative transposase
LAQIAERRVHPAGNAAVAGGWAALVEGYVEHYNNVRLNSAIGYITPKDMLAGRQQEIHAERDRKLEEARKQRQIRRQQAA